jgi:hypothetical protein
VREAIESWLMAATSSNKDRQFPNRRFKTGVLQSAAPRIIAAPSKCGVEACRGLVAAR